MKTSKLAVLPLVIFSGYGLAESTLLNTVKEYMAVWNAHDASQAVQSLADNAVYCDAVTGEPINGREKAEREVIGASIKAVPDLSWKTIGRPVYDEDAAASHWEFSGENGDERVGSPPTNDPIKFEGVNYTHVKVGKVTQQGDYYDSEKLGEELKPMK